MPPCHAWFHCYAPLFRWRYCHHTAPPRVSPPPPSTEDNMAFTILATLISLANIDAPMPYACLSWATARYDALFQRRRLLILRRLSPMFAAAASGFAATFASPAPLLRHQRDTAKRIDVSGIVCRLRLPSVTPHSYTPRHHLSPFHCAFW